MRLNSYIAHHCPYSRREADMLIAQGRVRIDRQKANIGMQLSGDEKVFLDGKLIKPYKDKHYTLIIYHKPKGELVSTKDDRGRRIIYDSLESKFHTFTTVGRLDFASEGLLVLSDSKRVASALMHSDLEREYIVKINTHISTQMLEAMENGLQLQNITQGAHPLSTLKEISLAPFVNVQIIKNTPRFSRLKLTLKEGRNREIRRFFGYFKANVLDLRRIRYGFLHLNALPVGKWRYLNKDEYKKLRAFLNNQ